MNRGSSFVGSWAIARILRTQRSADKDKQTNLTYLKEKLMPRVKFTKEHLLGRKQLAAGWRGVTVQSITEESGKNDPTSVNFVVTVVVTGGPDEGVVIKNWFSQKDIGMRLFSKFVECFTKDHQIDLAQDYDLDKLVGKQVDAYCQYDLQRQWNTVSDWRPASRQAVTA
jgi:hypothetical protein